MPRPISLSIRREVVALWQRHYKQPEIASRMSISLGSVKNIIKRYKQRGASGLKPDYDKCGARGVRSDELVYRQFVALRIWHPSWGYDKIASLIAEKYPDRVLVDRRTVYRWWHRLGLVKKTSIAPKRDAEWSDQLHDIWQIDAKEMINTQDGQKCSWLNIVDEGSGMVIDPPVFSQGQNLRGSDTQDQG